MRVLGFVLALAAVGSVVGDLYLHNPRGSNDRNRERNDNRNNDNRLFDSQNNAKGGYPWPGLATLSTADPLQLLEGSILPIEWTAQHSCGPGTNAFCNVVIQYACTDTMPALRDGYPTGGVVASDNNNAGYQRRAFQSQQQNADGTNTVPCPNNINCPAPNFNDGALQNVGAQTATFYSGGVVNNHRGTEFAFHESFDTYLNRCLRTQRNKGLYTADQNLNGNSARYTRQNPNGGRSGLECPEERDYYPYWQPSQWKDAAIFVTDTAWCPYFQSESQNVKARSVCTLTDAQRNNAPDKLNPISQAACTAAGGTWTTVPAFGIAPPECRLHPVSRDNHLGNAAATQPAVPGAAADPIPATYNWRVPAEAVGKQCVLRVRYNMSSANYPAVNSFATGATPFIDSKFNCRNTQRNAANDAGNYLVDRTSQCADKLTATSKPLINRPYVAVFANAPRLGLAINTNQVSRTFQDRTYLLKVDAKPAAAAACTRIINLGQRGKRGNIVQAYPAVEYDFVPQTLDIAESDCVHIQFLGSDFNAEKNPNNGEGWRFSDRTNMVQADTRNQDFPTILAQQTLFKDVNVARTFAFGGLTDLSKCKPFQNGQANEQNSIENCGKLNPAPAHFNAGIQKFTAGTYQYINTRNNNFSNRAQKGTINVKAGAWVAQE